MLQMTAVVKSLLCAEKEGRKGRIDPFLLLLLFHTMTPKSRTAHSSSSNRNAITKRDDGRGLHLSLR